MGPQRVEHDLATRQQPQAQSIHMSVSRSPQVLSARTRTPAHCCYWRQFLFLISTLKLESLASNWNLLTRESPKHKSKNFSSPSAGQREKNQTEKNQTDVRSIIPVYNIWHTLQFTLLPMQVMPETRFDRLKEGLATHSSIPTWRIPWSGEPGGLQSIRSQRVGHDWSDLALTHSVWDRTEKNQADTTSHGIISGTPCSSKSSLRHWGGLYFITGSKKFFTSRNVLLVFAHFLSVLSFWLNPG